MHESGQISSRPHTGPSPQKVAFWKGNGTPAISPGKFRLVKFFNSIRPDECLHVLCQGDAGGDTNPNQDTNWSKNREDLRILGWWQLKDFFLIYIPKIGGFMIQFWRLAHIFFRWVGSTRFAADFLVFGRIRMASLIRFRRMHWTTRTSYTKRGEDMKMTRTSDEKWRGAPLTGVCLVMSKWAMDNHFPY